MYVRTRDADTLLATLDRALTRHGQRANGVSVASDGIPDTLLVEDPIVRAAVAIVTDLDRALYATWWARVAGTDTHPGGEQLKLWWTKGPGLAKWATKTHRWTALYHHLLKHMDGNEALAKATASRWFHDVFGYWPGHQKGANPVGPG